MAKNSKPNIPDTDLQGHGLRALVGTTTAKSASAKSSNAPAIKAVDVSYQRRRIKRGVRSEKRRENLEEGYIRFASIVREEYLDDMERVAHALDLPVKDLLEIWMADGIKKYRKEHGDIKPRPRELRK